MNQERPQLIDVHAVKAQQPNLCYFEWGHCLENYGKGEPRDYGKPSPTPHVCGSVLRHAMRIHICLYCTRVGGIVPPSPFSKAGREMKRLKRMAEEQKAQREAKLAEVIGLSGERVIYPAPTTGYLETNIEGNYVALVDNPVDPHCKINREEKEADIASSTEDRS